MKKPIAPQLQRLYLSDRKQVRDTLIHELGLKDARSLEPYLYGRVNMTPLAEKFIRSTFAHYGVEW